MCEPNYIMMLLAAIGGGFILGISFGSGIFLSEIIFKLICDRINHE